MNQTYASEPDGPEVAKLPRRDWILLPLLGIITVAALGASTEWYARQVFPQSSGDIYQCIVGGYIPNGTKGVPNSNCRGNRGDSPIVSYQLNSCGHRAGMECGPKPTDTYRIVMVGSSFAIGEGVPREKTLAAVLPIEVSAQTGRRVDLYNEGMFSETAMVLAPHFDQLMAAQPDLVLWLITPYDIKLESVVMMDDGAQGTVNDDSETGKKLSLTARIRRRIRATLANRPVSEAANVLFEYYLQQYSNRLTSVVLLRHVLDGSQSQYVKSYLANPDAEFLDARPGVGWQNNLTLFERDYSAMEAQASAAGVPLVLALMPNRAQAAILSMRDWPPGIDPLKLDEDLRIIVSRHGGTYIDILPAFRNIQNPEQYFYLVNGHPDERGSALLAGMLAKELTSGSIPALRLEQAR